MKMVIIAYNEAIDAETMEALKKTGLENYTKIGSAYGKGMASGVHLGNDIWPGRNNILYIACDEAQTRQIASCVQGLRKKLGAEGIKAFVLPLEGLTEKTTAE